jgi:hypothetical protein
MRAIFLTPKLCNNLRSHALALISRCKPGFQPGVDKYCQLVIGHCELILFRNSSR